MRALISLPTYVCVALAIILGSAPVPAHAEEATVEQARAYVNEVARDTLAIISGNASKKAKQQKLETLFAAHVDIPWVGRFVLGRYWRKASEAQRDRYLKEYKSFILANYASRFAEYSSGTYTITEATDDGDGQFTVTMEMASAEQSKPIVVDYKLHTGDNNKFSVFDVAIEGVSMITTQRAEFASVISSHGLDYLITQLANKSLPMPDQQIQKDS